MAHGRSALAARAVLPTQDPAFIAACNENFLRGSVRCTIEAEESGDLVGLAPLVRNEGPSARWRLVGDREVHEPGAPLVRETDGAERLAERLCALDRAVEFSRLPADSPLVDAMARATRGRGMLVVRPSDPCPYLPLDGGWTEPETRFSARRRSDFRRAQRKAETFGRVDYAMHRPSPAEFDPLFDEAVTVEAKGWKRAAGSAILCDAAKEGFFRDYLRAMASRGELRIAAMRVDGRLVAMHLALVWRGRYWLYKIGFDEDYAKCSPGTLLMLFALGHCASEGLTGFEMMGEADSWISDFWTREAHECLRLRFYPRTPAGLAALARDGAAWCRARILRRERGAGT